MNQQSLPDRAVRKVRRTLINWLDDRPSIPVVTPPQSAVVTSSLPSRAVEMPDYWYHEENHKIEPDAEQLKQFKDKHKGERCFIVGNGPSLNETNLTKLGNEVTFGVNGIFYKTDDLGFVPTYYVVEDSAVVADNLDRINTYLLSEHRFFPTMYKSKITDRTKSSFFKMNRGFYETTSPNYGIPRFSSDISERIYTGQSVTYVNMQLAFYMGFETVYLIGVDFSYSIPDSAEVDGLIITSTEDDPNHFHPDYFGKGKRWKLPQLERVRRNYEFADLVFKWHDRRILNATKGGQLDVYDRVDYDSLF